MLAMDSSTGISRITPMHCSAMACAVRPSLEHAEQPLANSTAPRIYWGIRTNTITMIRVSRIGSESLCASSSSVIKLSAKLINAKNIGQLLNLKHYRFVPFGQDQPTGKPTSLIADFTKIPQTLADALDGKQQQPILLS